MNWYYLDARRERMGPFDDSAFEALIPDGGLKADTLVWNETLDDWTRADETIWSSRFPSDSQPLPPPPPPDSQPESRSKGCRPRGIGCILAGTIPVLLIILFVLGKACSSGPDEQTNRSRPNYYVQQVEMWEKTCKTCVGRGRVQTTCRGCGGAGTINTPSGYVTTWPT